MNSDKGFRNIYRQHRTEKKVIIDPLESELEIFFNLSLDLFCLADLDGCLQRVNQAWERVLGWTQEELLSQPWIEFMHPEDLETSLKAAEQCREEPLFRFENRFRHKDGSYRVIGWSSSQSKNGLTCAVGRDITEQKQAEAELRKYQEQLEELVQQRTAALEETSSQYRTLVKNYPNGGVSLFDSDLRYTLAEGSDLAEWGMSEEDFKGKTPRELWPPALCDLLEPYYRAALKGEESVFEMCFGELTYQVCAVPVKNEQGEICAGMVMSQNITKRKQAEAEVEKSLALLRATLEATADGILVTDGQGKILNYNRKFVETWGIPESIMASQDDAGALEWVMQQLKEPAMFLQTVQDLYAQTDYKGYSILEFKDGRICERYVVTQRWGDQSWLYVTSFRDITEKKQAEDALRESEARMRQQAQRAELLNQLAGQIRNSLDLDTILETAVVEIGKLLQLELCHFAWYQPNPLANAGEEGGTWEVVREANHSNVVTFLGQYPVDKENSLTQRVLNQEIVRIDDLAHSTDPAELDFQGFGFKALVLLPVPTRSGKFGAITCGQFSASRFWIESEVALLQAVCAQLEIAINQADLYAQTRIAAKAAQEQATQLELTLTELQRTQAQLIQTEKMSSLGQLVAGVAHEINNPINFIHGNLSYAKDYTFNLLELIKLYQQHYSNPPAQIQREIEAIDLEFLALDLPKLLDSMKVGTERIREIVLSLRTFSRLDEAEMKEVDIHEGIESTLMILASRFKAKPTQPAIHIIKEYGSLPLVECYAGQLNQVFMNILTNAIDALEEQVGNNDSTSSIRIRTGAISDSSVAIRIADNGPGMNEAVCRRLFDPFFTTKAIGKGTGLGLSISYQIISNKHRGKLTCVSKIGQGTEFIIEIPIRQAKPFEMQN